MIENSEFNKDHEDMYWDHSTEYLDDGWTWGDMIKTNYEAWLDMPDTWVDEFRENYL